MSEETKADIAALVKEIEQATERVQQAERDYYAAARAKTGAINQLSDLQRMLSAAVIQMKRDAPSDSAWGSSRRVFGKTDPEAAE